MSMFPPNVYINDMLLRNVSRGQDNKGDTTVVTCCLKTERGKRSSIEMYLKKSYSPTDAGWSKVSSHYAEICKIF